MIKHFSPKRIIEIGSGFSTLVMARAVISQEIEQAQLVSINPFPGEFEELFTTGFPGFSKLIKVPVEDMDLAFFDKLAANDILFIDS